jgi:hypothetical protein
VNQFQKNVIFIALTACFLGAIGYGVNYAIQEHARHLEEQKIAWHKANIKALKDLSAIGALSTEEQIRVDNAGDDVDRLQQVLLDIHQERINYWSNVLEEAKERKQKLQGMYSQAVSYGLTDKYNDANATIVKNAQKAAMNVLGYTAAKEKIRDWKPISFEDYRAGKLLDAPASTKVSDQ